MLSLIRTRAFGRTLSAPIASRSFSRSSISLAVPDESKPADQQSIDKATLGIHEEHGKSRETDKAPGSASVEEFKAKAARVEQKREQAQDRMQAERHGEAKGRHREDGLNTPVNDSVEIGKGYKQGQRA